MGVYGTQNSKDFIVFFLMGLGYTVLQRRSTEQVFFFTVKEKKIWLS